MSQKCKVIYKATTHAKFAKEDAVFNKACEKAGVPNTKRQASKFRMGRGQAFANRK